MCAIHGNIFINMSNIQCLKTPNRKLFLVVLVDNVILECREEKKLSDTVSEMPLN